MSLVQMSLSGGIMVMVIILARALFLRRLPKKTFLALWGVVLLRLLVPFSLPSEGSFYTHMQRSMDRMEKSIRRTSDLFVPVAQTDMVSADSHILPTAAQGQPDQLSDKLSDQLPSWEIVWMVGTVLCTIFFLTAYLRCRREFRMSLPVQSLRAQEWLDRHPLRRKTEIRQTDRIQAPLTYGLFHPVILVPKDLDWEDETALEFILEHELVHIQRFDVIVKLIIVGALCLHWFNPLVWVMYLFFNRDLELACDETVVRRFGEDTRSAYALVLIGMEEKKSGFMPLCSSFGKSAIEERIGAIMKIRRLSVFTGILAVMLIAGITSVFAISAATEGEQISESYEIALQTVNQKYMSAEAEYIQLSAEIAQKEMELQTEEDNDALIKELETLKEQREQQLIRQAGLSELRELLTDYGEYGITVQFLSLDAGGYLLYWNDSPVRYLVDETNYAVLWADDENGEVVLDVIRDEAGNITGLQNLTEEVEDITGQEEAVSENASLAETESEEETSAAISIIGGADGPTSVFIAGKLGGSDSSKPEVTDAISEEEYHQYLEANEDNREKGMSKTVKKNYVSGEDVPYAISYSEYTEGDWWGGILKKTDVSPLAGSELFQATFEGMLYKQ